MPSSLADTLQAVGARYDEALEAALRADFARVEALLDQVDQLVASAGGPVSASTAVLLRSVQDRRSTLAAALEAQRTHVAAQLEQVQVAHEVLARYGGPQAQAATRVDLPA